MSAIIQVQKCANADCKNILTSYEIERIKKFPSNKMRKENFCIKCRRFQDIIHYAHCQRCNERFQYKNWRKYCESCSKTRRVESVVRSRRSKIYYPQVKDQIKYLFTTHKIVTQGEIMSFVARGSWHSIRTIMSRMRKDGFRYKYNRKLDAYEFKGYRN